MRANAIREKTPKRTAVFTLPVGSPDWIRPVPPPAREGGLRVLYTGGALPLHGVPFLFRGLAKTKETSTTLSLIFAVPPERFQYFRSLTEELGIAERCLFLDPTSHRELIRTVQEHDVVVGVFGDSPKARSVLANKVWQGLASSRTIVTRSTPALAEIAETAGDLLRAVETEDELAAVLDDLAALPELPYDPDIADKLDEYVRSRYAEFVLGLRARIRKTPHTRKKSMP
jgi:glycosyltransferase involved in cell wall biosynthesis